MQRKQITNTRQGPDTAVSEEKKKGRKKTKLMPDSNIITQENCTKPSTEMFAFLCSHIRAVNATRVQAPVQVPRQKQNHSFMAMPGARITNRNRLNNLGDEQRSHLTSKRSQHSGEAQGRGWNRNTADSEDRLQGCDRYHH